MNIKKFLAAGLLMMMAQLTFAQVSNTFFEALKGAKGAELVEVGEELMALAKAAADDPEEKAMMEKMKSMKMLHIDVANTPQALPKARAAAEKLEKAGMTKLLSELEDAQEASIYLLKKGNIIQELFIWGYDNEDGFYSIQMNGTFTEDELGELTKMAR